MSLLVKYVDDGTGYIAKYELEHLLSSGKIKAFKRSNGEWVNPKEGPIRGYGSPNSYAGHNRRSRF
jgi:hypothetical protein